MSCSWQQEQIKACADGVEAVQLTWSRPVVEGEEDLNSDKLCNIFTYWPYNAKNKNPQVYLRLNVESWRRHTQGQCNEPILVDDRNVKKWIPDLPDEFFNLPYPEVKSDFIRLALLYHHGGIFMHPDYLIVRDIARIIKLLPDFEVLSFLEGGDQSTVPCDQLSFSFLAGPKGSDFFRKSWEQQKKEVTNHCNDGEETDSRTCCYDSVSKNCHVPFGLLGDRLYHRFLLKEKSLCFRGKDSFSPEQYGYVMDHAPKLEDALKHWKKSNVVDPLERMVYPLWGSSKMTDDCKTLFDNSTVLGTLLTTSFTSGKGGQAVPQSKASDWFQGAHPELQLPDGCIS